MSVLTELEAGITGALDGHECEAIWEFFGIEALCGEPAVGRYRRICVHEHVKDGYLCREHVDNAPRGLCGTCFELPGDLSHECPISIAEVTA